jgi:hypothetical protein
MFHGSNLAAGADKAIEDYQANKQEGCIMAKENR